VPKPFRFWRFVSGFGKVPQFAPLVKAERIEKALFSAVFETEQT
jgi:hypothetical protein